MSKISKKTLGRRRRMAALLLLLLLIILIYLIVKLVSSAFHTIGRQGENVSDIMVSYTTTSVTAETEGLTLESTTSILETITTETTTTTTTQYTVSDISELPRSALLEVDPVLQNPELPTGCEITSLTMALNYAGFDVDKLTIADDYLICADAYTATFGEAFIGSPYDSTAWGCYVPVIEKTANKYLTAQGSSMTASDLTGSSFETLLGYVSNGTPVVTWVSINLTANIVEKYYWTTDDGDDAIFLVNEHCVLLCGYDLDANTVTVADPLKGLIVYDMDTFRDRFKTMYSQAVIIQ
ncbi:MAG: C39 family peptidase [Ruminococcus sp.]|nr:C39 family peptidase [Ruminococcus sp.]